jgi:hypothetical protein
MIGRLSAVDLALLVQEESDICRQSRVNKQTGFRRTWTVSNSKAAELLGTLEGQEPVDSGAVHSLPSMCIVQNWFTSRKVDRGKKPCKEQQARNLYASTVTRMAPAHHQDNHHDNYVY